MFSRLRIGFKENLIILQKKTSNYISFISEKNKSDLQIKILTDLSILEVYHSDGFRLSNFNCFA